MRALGFAARIRRFADEIFFAGAAGGLYAAYLSFIDPTSFDINVSVLIVTMLVVGGARTLAGSVIGPFLLLALPQILAELGHVAEGVLSAPTVLQRARSLGVAMPITEAVVGVLQGRVTPAEALAALMGREARPEH